MKKILFVINQVSKGGPSNVVYNLISELYKNYNVTLLTIFDKNDIDVIKKYKDMNINLKSLNLNKNFISLIKAYRLIKEYIKNNDFNIVHTNGIYPDIIISKIKGKFKKVSTIHCNFFEDYINTFGKIKGNIFIKLQLNALKNIDNVVACSESVYYAIKEKVKNTTFVRNGIAKRDVIVNENILNELNLPKDAIIYCFAGRLTKGKNVLPLIQMFSNVKNNNNAYLLVIGDGPLIDECNKYASENIKILGYKHNIDDYLKISDIYVSNSKSEGMSIAILEALNYGMYLFVSDIPSHNEVINLADNLYIGEIFNKENFESKKKIIEEKIKNKNKEKIKKFKDEQFSSKSMMKGYVNIYEEK